MSPTQRSLAELRKRGYTVAIVEKTIPRTFIKQDLFGMFDLLAIHPEIPGALGVQTTSRSNMNARIKKLQANPVLALWIHAGLDATVHGWSKRGPRGKRKLWALDEVAVLP